MSLYDLITEHSVRMQNPNEDTQWNDVLRSKGILPPKEKEATIDEQTLVQVKYPPPIYATNKML